MNGNHHCPYRSCYQCFLIANIPSTSNDSYIPFSSTNNPSSSRLPSLHTTLSTSTHSYHRNIHLPPINSTHNQIFHYPLYYIPQYGQRFHFRSYQFNPTPRAYNRRNDNKSYDQNSQYATKEKMKNILAPTDSGIPELKYQLEVVQQPVRARMCGFGERDRRLISPLPFLRLKLSTEEGPVDIHEIDPGFFVVHASLYDAKTNREAMLVIHPSSMPGKPQCVDNLVGEKATHGKILFDTQENEDIWFVFRDLSVRAEGTFYIKFTLIHLGWQGNINTGKSPIQSPVTTCSDIFTVYTAKRFPGMIATTRLALCFVKQGIKIPTRRDSSKNQFDEVEEDTEVSRKRPRTRRDLSKSHFNKVEEDTTVSRKRQNTRRD
ncbi:hypothetical protein RclHR1_08790001 [Rhizophagus clarus]|uniref:Velvet factor n=1 Tax=Rhizophagus clarus TaxID=94130 RepID=A0A2Z6SG38_9GLOM|nr:hypothetical protein RclHR1_08790001 [Rhizophagus clarus]GES89223.1 velvet factor [Rhizophagus clarus]